MKYLITGGCGFIGSNFILYLLKKYADCRIINLDKLTYAGNKENLKSVESHGNYQFVQGDICDKDLVNDLIKEVDIVVHFAAETHVDRSVLYADEFVKTNVLGTQVLLDAAVRAGNKRFHHVSTDEVYGSLGKEGKFSESSPFAPRSPYAASKAAADLLVMSYFDTYNLPVTISNCSNNFGPFQFPEKLMPLFITNLIDNTKVPVYGDGKNVRDWIHVDDHNKAVDLVIQKGKIGETYCIGADCELTNLEITKKILSAFNFGGEMINFVQDRKGHDFRYAIDNTKMCSLGWKPEHTFDTALAQTIDWYRNNESWWRPLKQKVIGEITKKQ